MEEFNLGKFLADSGVNLDTGNGRMVAYECQIRYR